MKGECGLGNGSKRARTLLWFLALPWVGVALSPGSAAAQPYAYIPVYGAEVNNSVAVIDTATDTVTAVIPVEPVALALAVNPAGTRVYTTSVGGVSVIDTATNSVIATVRMGEANRYGVAVHPNGTRVYVTNAYGAGWVSVIDAASNTVIATVPVVCNAGGVAVHPDGSRVYVTNGCGGGGVSVIDTASNTVIATVPVDGNGGLAVHPDGTRLYVPGYESSHGALAVVDTTTYAVSKVPVGRGPVGVAVHPDGSRVYVTDKDNLSDFGGVSVVDTTTNAVVAEVRYEREVQPEGLSVHPDGSRLYVAADGITVIETETNSIARVVPVECCVWAIGQFIGPPVTIANVDIRPGTKANAISPKDRGVVPVAILTSDTFDATLVDPSTARFGATGIEAAATGSTLRDVDRDGHLDAVLNFNIRDTGIACGQSMASLTGRTSGGQAIVASDAIQTMGCR